MATFTKFQPFVANLAAKKIDLSGDGLTIALCAAGTPPVAANGVLADLTTIAYTNLSARVVTVVSCTQTAGVLKLICTDLGLTASGNVAAFQYVVLFDDDATSDELIAFWDRGNVVTMISGDVFTVDFDPDNGVLQIE